MLEYDIVSDKIYLSEEPDFVPDLYSFTKEVNRRIGQGWIPLGRHCITKCVNNLALITQTLIRDRDIDI